MEQPQPLAIAMPEMVTSSELSYKKKDFTHPKYKLTQLYPLSGRQTATLTASGGDEVIFQLPVKCFNLAKSVLSLTLTTPTPGASAINVIHVSPFSYLRQIILETNGGVKLVEAFNVNKFMDVCHAPETSFSDFQTLPSSWSTNVDKQRQHNIGSYPSRAAGNTTAINNEWTARVALVDNDDLGEYIKQDANPYIEKLQIRTAQAINTAITDNIRIEMKHFKNSIFNTDKDLYFGEILNLRLIFASKGDYAFTVNTLDGGAGDAAKISSLLPNGTSADVAVTDIQFFLATEQNLDIANNIIEKVNSTGLTIPIPFYYSYKQAIQTSTNQSISIRMNSGHGKKLRRIYHTPIYLESLVSAYLRDNTVYDSGTKVKIINSFYTTLNNDREQDFNIDCIKRQDYMLLSHKLKDSVVLDAEMYQNKWFWVSDYTSEAPLHSKESQDVSLSSGVPLASEQKWEIYMTLPVAKTLNHYTHVVVEKELNIRPGNITCN